MLPGPADALSLGRVQGSAWIGRPLQLAIPVTLQPGDDPCVQAELAQGEEPATALPSRLAPLPGGSATLRLSSNVVVQEPVVTVRVTLGCSRQVSQSYVLLAELPPARESLPVLERLGSPQPEPDSAPARMARSAEPTTATPTASAPEKTPARPASPRRQPQPAASSSEQPPRPATAPQQIRREPTEPTPSVARSAGAPRLQLALLDLDVDQAPVRKVSTDIALPPGGEAPREEARPASQAMSPPTADQLAALQEQSEAMLAELRDLREITRRQSEQLGELQAQRALLRDLLAGLAGAAAVGLAVLLWRRQRESSGRRWWQGARTLPRHEDVQDSSFVDSSYPEPPLPAPPPQDDSGWSDFSRPQSPVSRGAGAGTGRTSSFGDSVLSRSRLPSAEELLDVQEKANFFLAIGQPDEAIGMLEARLLELGSSPFLWLDLLDLCRRLGRADDYERLRQQFQQAFAARLPSFTEAPPNTEGLERYPRALSRILLLWPSSRVLKEIEKALFEDPAPGSIMFDLEASRDLLLLYSIAHDVVTAHPDGRPYDKTALAALAPDDDRHAHEGAQNTQPVPLAALDGQDDSAGEPALDLELDFSRIDVVLPAPVSSAPLIAIPETVRMPLDHGIRPEPADSMAAALDISLDELERAEVATAQAPSPTMLDLDLESGAHPPRP